MNRVLCFDFGATSGRAVVFQRNGDQLEEKFIHRFKNTPKIIDGTYCWDLELLNNEFFCCIEKATAFGGFEAVSIDSWGVDFVSIGYNGEVVTPPAHYRDNKNEIGVEGVRNLISDNELYHQTGIQHNQINTIYRLKYLVDNEPEVVNKTDKILMIADYFAYLLTGNMRLEVTNASTTGLLEPYNQVIDSELCSLLSIPEKLFPETIKYGECYGEIKPEIANKYSCKGIKVFASLTHDTASAVFALPSNQNSAFISCGTWSLFGTILDEPLISFETKKCNFTNEVGYNSKTRFLKNIPGSWLIEEHIKETITDGKIDYDALEREAKAEIDFETVIDTNDPIFFSPGSNGEKVKIYCAKTNQRLPENIGQYMVAVYKGLANKYKEALSELENLTGKTFDIISMVGGGSRSELLCTLTSQKSGKIVEAGPHEATVYGNAVCTLIALGDIKDSDEAKKLIRNSCNIKTYDLRKKGF